jgi:hypothetical protein
VEPAQESRQEDKVPNDNWLSEEQKDRARKLLSIAGQSEREAMNMESDPLGLVGDAPRWDKASRQYRRVVGFLDAACRQAGRNRIDLPEDTKQLAVSAWIGRYRCMLHMTRDPDLEIYRYDVGKQIGREIKSLERKIASYQVKHQAHLWNILQGVYDQWGEERRDYGMKYEADELQYHMLKAQMRRERWRLSSRKSPLLSLVNAARRKWVAPLRARIPTRIKGIARGIDDFSSFLHAWVEWALYAIGKGLVWPFILFVALPIVLFAFLYARTDGLRLESGALLPEPFPQGPLRFWYALYFSVFVFTGSEPGALTTCGNPTITGLMALEAIFAYIFMVVVIGYLVNRLSSR